MQDVRPGSTVEILEHLHRRLDVHFCQLRDVRRKVGDGTTPVFALEHDLSEADLKLLNSVVRAAVVQGFGAKFRVWWLPFVVYAAESGYGYTGEEYWPTYEASTPFWREHGDRDRLRGWFVKFATDYDGAVPKGAFAAQFPIIAWPITHAVLPRYLQRNLAQLLFEFSNGLTSDLLHNPSELGTRLASRVGTYTERFRVFCENTTLLGQVAAALLSGEEENFPYLTHATLMRLVDGLSREQQSRLWLASARQSANSIRLRGFQTGTKSISSPQRHERVPSTTDPKLLLRVQGGGWSIYAKLPDLSVLRGRLPHLYDELRTSRVRVGGSSGTMLATGRLIYSGQEVQLKSLPDSGTPFLQLEKASATVNQFLADTCTIAGGPHWLFRRNDAGLAVEVLGKTLRPGGSYVLVFRETTAPPNLSWASETVISASGLRAFNLVVPQTLSETDASDIIAAGISVASDVLVRPVGIVASAWDGDGSVEWLTGEPGLIAIQAERTPDTCVVAIEGHRFIMPWPEGELELFLALTDLTIGTHNLTVMLMGKSKEELGKGALVVTIRDPQTAPEGTSSGEGIRLLAAPAWPTLSDLWDGRATVSIDGPPNTQADLSVILSAVDGSVLADIRRTLSLPLSSEAWTNIAKEVRDNRVFQHAYDDAESGELLVSRSGIGFARLTCDRGFQPLRWRTTRRQNGSRTARLLDRTDGRNTLVELFTVDEPTVAVPCPSDSDIEAPPRGGLLRATAAEVQNSIILPTDPSRLLHMGQVRPLVQTSGKLSHEVLRLAKAHLAWSEAELPADVFALHGRDAAREAITREIVSLIAGTHWARLERKLVHVDDVSDYLDDMRDCVGDSDNHKAVAAKIGSNLWNWLTPGALLSGFAQIMEGAIQSSGISCRPAATRFLLTLAGRPGYIANWNAVDRDELLERIMGSPVLLRAARFAVLGTRALQENNEGGTGF